MKVYVALNSTPDFSSPAPSFNSVHATFAAAARALFPDRLDFQESFASRSTSAAGRPEVWIGPDGFGEIREVELELPTEPASQSPITPFRVKVDGEPELPILYGARYVFHCPSEPGASWRILPAEPEGGREITIQMLGEKYGAGRFVLMNISDGRAMDVLIEQKTIWTEVGE